METNRCLPETTQTPVRHQASPGFFMYRKFLEKITSPSPQRGHLSAGIASSSNACAFFNSQKIINHRRKTGLFTYIEPSNGISGITVDWVPDYTMRNYQAVPNLGLPVMQGELLVKVVMRCTVNDKGNTASGGKTLFYFAIQETVSKLHCPRSTASLLTDPCMQSGLSRHPRNLFSLSRSVPQIQARDDVL